MEMGLLDTKHKKKSFIITSVLLLGILFLLFFFGLNYLDPPPEKGISVRLGTAYLGANKVLSSKKNKSIPVKQSVQKEKEMSSKPVKQASKTEKVLTTNDEKETISINKSKKKNTVTKKQSPTAEEKERERREKEEAKKKKEQDLKRKKLDQLIGNIGKSSGKGENRAIGNQGQSNGNPYASRYFGDPSSNTGKQYGLSGRTLKGGTGVKQDCNEEGRVVVKIEVDRSGKVVKAIPGVRGTTNNHPCLLKPAKATAMQHRWNADNKAPNRQIGFVVVNFKLGE